MIPALVEEHNRSAPGTGSLSVVGTPVPLAPVARVSLYRTAQEALSNVRKHAPGARVTVELAWYVGRVQLTVADDGPEHGAPGPAAVGSGYGLTGMTERAELLGGWLEAGSTGAGFRVVLSLPTEQEAA
jgi:signal transduction histidine kinase